MGCYWLVKDCVWCHKSYILTELQHCVSNMFHCISEAGAQSVAKARRCNRSEDQGPPLMVPKVGLNDFNVWGCTLTPPKSTNITKIPVENLFLLQELTSPGLGVYFISIGPFLCSWRYSTFVSNSSGVIRRIHWFHALDVLMYPRLLRQMAAHWKAAQEGCCVTA